MAPFRAKLAVFDSKNVIFLHADILFSIVIVIFYHCSEMKNTTAWFTMISLFFSVFLFVVFYLIQLMLMSVLNCLFESLSQIFRWVLPNLQELQNRYPAGLLWFHEEKPCFSQRGVCEVPRCTVDLLQTFQGVMRLVHMQIKQGVFLHMQLKLSAGSSWCCYYGNRCRSNAACEHQSQADYLRLKAVLRILNWLQWAAVLFEL